MPIMSSSVPAPTEFRAAQRYAAAGAAELVRTVFKPYSQLFPNKEPDSDNPSVRSLDHSERALNSPTHFQSSSAHYPPHPACPDPYATCIQRGHGALWRRQAGWRRRRRAAWPAGRPAGPAPEHMPTETGASAGELGRGCSPSVGTAGRSPWLAAMRRSAGSRGAGCGRAGAAAGGVLRAGPEAARRRWEVAGTGVDHRGWDGGLEESEHAVAGRVGLSGVWAQHLGWI
jgi:hypothetical protein